RYLDGYPCFDCGTVDLAVHDLNRLLGDERGRLPDADRPCPVCGGACHGPLGIECFGVGEPPLAFLAPKDGAPLCGRLCASCGRVRLSLHPGDSEARAELAARFPDEGPCPFCGVGRRRVTHLDVPYSGPAGLYRPPSSTGTGESGRRGRPVRVAGLMVATCDSCGEASTWL